MISSFSVSRLPVAHPPGGCPPPPPGPGDGHPLLLAAAHHLRVLAQDLLREPAWAMQSMARLLASLPGRL